MSLSLYWCMDADDHAAEQWAGWESLQPGQEVEVREPGKAGGAGAIDDLITTGVQVLADSAYGTGELLRALAVAGHTALIKPKPLARAIEGGFTIDDFTYDQQARTLTCPGGLVRAITAKGYVTSGACCTGCPLKSRCTTADPGRKSNCSPSTP